MFQFTKCPHINLLLITLTLALFNIRWINGQGSSLARTIRYRDDGEGEIAVPRTSQINLNEPSCDELLAMWRYSKRQSRAAVFTNEIPTYHDPFTNNVWESYTPTARNGARLRSKYQEPGNDFGTMVLRPPSRTRLETGRVYADVTGKTRGPPPMRPQSRTGGGGHMPLLLKGRFQTLKQMIGTEKARELEEQRRAEEMEARAAVLKEITNGRGYRTRHNQPIIRDGYDTYVLPPSSSSILSSRDIIDERMAEISNPIYNDNSRFSSLPNKLNPSYERDRNRSKLRQEFPAFYDSRRDKAPSIDVSSVEE